MEEIYLSLVDTAKNIDKVYNIKKEKNAIGQYSVVAYYGRRYQVKNRTIKGENLTKAEADELFDKVLHEKLKKGYVQIR